MCCLPRSMSQTLLSVIRKRDVITTRRILLENIEKYDLEEQNEREDGSPLFWAACLGLEDIVEILISLGASVNARNCWEATPLHAAADTNKISIVRILLEHGGDAKSKTLHGDTPCHLAAYRGYTDVVKLLARAGADVTCKNLRGYDVIKEALTQGYFPLVEWLYSYKKLGIHTDRSNSAAQKKNVTAEKNYCQKKLSPSLKLKATSPISKNELRTNGSENASTISLSRNAEFTPNLVRRQISHSLARSSLDIDTTFISNRPLSWPGHA